MKSAPLVSVVLPVYNGEMYIAQAVDSILNQTFKDFELIVINDGSTDKTAEILNKYTDPRLQIITQENKGLVAALNRGIEAARGTYIARQDADDASLPERLQLQSHYLQQHAETVIVGSSMSVMNKQGTITHKHSVLLHDPELRQELLIRSPFAHGSVMFKKSAALTAGLYQQNFWPAEDYELWLRLSEHGKLANLDDYLYIYREHSGGISASNQKRQHDAVELVHKAAWSVRHRLVGGQKISLGTYKKLEDGQQRIERVLKNISSVSAAAKKQKDLRFAAKNAALLAASPLAYRKVAGIIKRKLKKDS